MIFDKLKSLKKYDPKAEQELYDEIQASGGLEKNDLLAMILSAMLVIMPIVILLFLFIVIFAFWLL